MRNTLEIEDQLLADLKQLAQSSGKPFVCLLRAAR
jgi:hypothetical protein